MKKKFGAAAVFVVAVLCVCALAACGEGGKGRASDGQGQGSGQLAPAKGAAAIVREDDEGLVRVRIGDGEASLSFDLERWDELYHIYSSDPGFFPEGSLREGPFTIAVQSGKVADACVGKVEGFDDGGYGFVTPPAVVLLMEDGSVEWLSADPYMTEDLSEIGGEYEGYQNFRSLGKFPLIDGIASLSYESDGEGEGGSGSMTVYATDRDGQRYDLRVAANFARMFFDGRWVCSPITPPDGRDTQDGILRFGENAPAVNGEATFSVHGQYDVAAEYHGSYTLTLADGDVYPAGTILFDLAPRYGNDAGGAGGIKGSYRVFVEKASDNEFDCLYLYLNEGDALYPEGADPTVYTFQKDIDAAYDEDADWTEGKMTGPDGRWRYSQGYDHLDYLRDSVPGIEELLNLDMQLRDESNALDIGSGNVHEVLLGTWHEEDRYFVTEAYYAVDFDTADIYKMDPLTGEWVLIFN